MRFFSAAYAFFRPVVLDTFMVTWTLFKVMFPVLVGVRFLEIYDLIRPIGDLLAPVMGAVGLPGETGLVWAMALLTSIQGGVLVQLSLDTSLTVAQATVLGTLMLTAHNMLVEAQIAHKAGARFLFQIIFRLGVALISAFLLHHLLAFTGWLIEPATELILAPPEQADSWGAWGVEKAFQFLTLMAVICFLVILMRLIEVTGLNKYIDRVMAPVLRACGMGENASSVMLVGLTMGMSYGGGLIVREARNGHLSARGMFLSVSFLGICHSLIEDSFLPVIIGADYLMIVVWRLLFTLLLIKLLACLVDRLSEKTHWRYFWSPSFGQSQAAPRTPLESP